MLKVRSIPILLITILLVNFLLIFTKNSLAYNPCGELTRPSGGPYDYTDPANKSTIVLVENFHFSSKVENLIGGITTMTPLGDINFVLNAFPNHHRALDAVSKYEIKKQRQAQQGGMFYNPETEGGRSAECYFDRAIRWRPNDPNVHLIYGIHLHRLGKLDQALVEYKISEKIQPNLADLQYNLGLLYFDKQQYNLAKEHAKKAYQLGYPLPGLRKKLASVGQWP